MTENPRAAYMRQIIANQHLARPFENRALSLMNVSGAFYLIASGLLLSTIAFLLELAIFKVIFLMSKRQKRTTTIPKPGNYFSCISIMKTNNWQEGLLITWLVIEIWTCGFVSSLCWLTALWGVVKNAAKPINLIHLKWCDDFHEWIYEFGFQMNLSRDWGCYALLLVWWTVN